MKTSNDLDAVKLEDPVPEAISKRVGEEVLTRNFEPGVWAQALAAVSGGRDEALAEYSRLRIAQLMGQQKRVRERAESMEFRRLHSCLGVTTVAELLRGMSRVGAANLPRPRLPMLWLAIMAVGLGGCLAAMVNLFAGTSPASTAPWLPVAALCGGLALVALGGVVTRLLPNHVLRWVWGEGAVAACGLACLASLMLGTKLLISRPRIQPAAPVVAAQVESLAPPAPVEVSQAGPGLLRPYFEGPTGSSMADNGGER